MQNTKPSSSSIVIDWSLCLKDIFQLQQNYGDEISALYVQYSPTTGVPQSPFRLNTPLLPINTINQTLPSVNYAIRLVAQFKDGKQYIIHQRNLYSSM